LLSRYRFGEKLGAGGMGVVLRAEDISLKRPVALKFLGGTALSQEQTRARFLREAQTAAALNHPNVCTIYEVGEVQKGEERPPGADEHLEPGTPFIAMELVEGRTLETIVRQSGSMPFDELLGIALQISDGMAAAHARGIVHRDLKPGNVMVTKEGRVKILDFGLAKPLEPAEPGDAAGTAAATASADLTREGRVIGTAAYMSPEQAKGEAVDSRSDVFSFGVMLYELAAGTRPFRGTTTLSTLAKIIEAEPEPIPDARADIPQELRRIVRRCLQKKPEDRYNDTRDLVAALKALRQESTSGAPRMASRASEPAPRPSGIRGRLVWVAAAGAMVVAAAGALTFWPKGGARSKPEPVTHRQITFSASAFSPDISPDGKSILFVSRTYGQQPKLFVQDLAGGQPLQIYAGDLLLARWSPSGTEIVLIERGEGKLRSAAVLPRLGGSPRRLDAPLPPNVNWYPAWSPDGARVAIAAEGGGLALVEIASEASKVLEPGLQGKGFFDLDWSPRGRILAAVVWTGSGRELVTFPEDGGSHRVVFPGDIGPMVRWTAAGDALYFLRNRGQTTDLWKIAVDPVTGDAEGEPIQVLTGFTVDPRISIPADGHSLVYARADTKQNIWLVEPGGGQGDATLRTRALTTGSQRHRQPALSPDGRTVAFVAGPDGEGNLFTVTLPDGAPRQITFLDEDCQKPVWSSDGKKIAFVSRSERASHVRVVDANGGVPRTYEKTTPGRYGELTWAPGTLIVYRQLGLKNFNVLDPETEREESLLQGETTGAFHWVFAEPSGLRFAVRWNRLPRAQVWLLTRGGAPPRVVLDRAWAFPMGWSADGKWIYVYDETDVEHRVIRVPVDGGPAETLFDVPFDSEASTASPDGKKFLFARVDTTSDVWIVENFDSDRRPE